MVWIYEPIPDYYIYYYYLQCDGLDLPFDIQTRSAQFLTHARTHAHTHTYTHTHTGKYGVAAGAVFGSIMWMLVVSLSDKAEGKPSGYG